MGKRMDWISFFIGLSIGGGIVFWLRRPRKRSQLDRPPASLPVLPHDLKQQILKLRAEGRQIDAIKLVRERTGCGLKEAKDAVDLLR
jgi:Ribosomal protein L7/L12 C-terminal domain